MSDVINPQFGQATQQGRNRNLALNAGELGAKAEMDAAAERQGRMFARVMSRRSGSEIDRRIPVRRPE